MYVVELRISLVQRLYGFVKTLMYIVLIGFYDKIIKRTRRIYNNMESR